MTIASHTPPWIRESDVQAALSLSDAIAVLEEVLRLEATGAAHGMLKTHVAWGEGHTLHAIGAALPSRGLAGTKTWAHTRRGAAPLLILFDAESGSARAVIEAFALGQLRTAAVSGVATRRLAQADAAVMAIIGSGKQAYSQVAAVAAVRALRHVRVHSPTAAHRSAFAARLRQDFGFEVSDHASVAEAVAGATIITLATRAREPILTPEMVASGTHINAIGAITPERMEFTPALLQRCTLITADSVAAARQLSRECMSYFGADAQAWERLLPLSRVLAENMCRNASMDVTLLKSMGSGVADVAMGVALLDRLKI